ncbi:long-chain-fatty-acid--CoA ligase [Streptomyces clavuligerus]|uniref:Moenomycin biosynthesis protein MoeA4 n=1 Tax=Streptomyces clavuligerus TaxID=1901 RepID=D5SLG7_STRCL|nr:long-chain fatty acid--CoA ligase [Streptomyces clavuligerus]EFG04760.1 Moenomycin biosynthesis protein MoeA4 [Streptomyces clavuligerus]MBY6306792.1 long-chain fatty acid--CoA ligase [Streptomyces clavuligerus]QCS10606.1 long-chain fatty acid--CoA ligase [Streptomyces clavuligerus]QPJ97357.1 AMP-binding protein [Streptomyces clavuligerus]WDN57315.1 long-chain fatty acid--CoA ligase [Streptomyces clavuligerus]
MNATLSAATVLADTAGRRPDHPALVAGAERITYHELWRSARRYAAVLREEGVGPGDRVALLLPNTPDFPRAYYGALALGATVVPVNALLKADEISFVLKDSAASVLICDTALTGEGARAAAATGTTLLTVGPPVVPAAAGTTRTAGTAVAAPAVGRALDARAAVAAPVAGWVPRAPDDIALILYTSGTTGRPKGAMITQLNLAMNVGTTVLAPFAMRPEDVLLGCLPLFHTFGQTCGMGTCFRAGATLVLMERFDADAALALMNAERCTVAMGVPTMFIGLLEAAARTPERPPLERVYSGGSALPVRVLEEVTRTFGCPVFEGYGLTETSPVVTFNQHPWPCLPGTVGRPIPGVEAEIADALVRDRIVLLPPEETGEIVVRGHNVMAGYLNNPAATAEVIMDGWFRTGDLGTKDAEGVLTVVDRTKDMVIRGGYNVYPREIEEILARHPAVAQAAVVGVPDERLGQEVCAVVVVRPETVTDGALAADIIAWTRARIAAYKYPRRVEFLTELPLGPSGKVLKRELAARFGS